MTSGREIKLHEKAVKHITAAKHAYFNLRPIASDASDEVEDVYSAICVLEMALCKVHDIMFPPCEVTRALALADAWEAQGGAMLQAAGAAVQLRQAVRGELDLELTEKGWLDGAEQDMDEAAAEAGLNRAPAEPGKSAEFFERVGRPPIGALASASPPGSPDREYKRHGGTRRKSRE